jgi:alkylation response protein AidB-like acyl-CoA dehydrogenase
MIDFGLSDEQEALQRSAREFLTRECPPALVRETAKSDDGVPRDLYRKIAELGWMGLIVPEKDGGIGLGALDLVIVLEELGRVAAPGPFLATQLAIAGPSTPARRTTRSLAATLISVTIRHARASRGRRPSRPGGRAGESPQDCDGYVISGTKLPVPEAQAADALVGARTKAGERF